MIQGYRLKKLIGVFFIFIISFAGAGAQDSNLHTKDFRITIQTKGKLIAMSCSGCAWKNLSFTLGSSQVQAVDQFGMTDLNGEASQADPDLANFTFTIARSRNGVALQGVSGMAWKELSFSLANDQQRAINRLGMLEPE